MQSPTAFVPPTSLEGAVTSVGEVTYLVSRDYARFTGGWFYNERLLEGLARRGWRVRRVELPSEFPAPDAHARAALDAALSELSAGSIVLGDQICLCPAPEILARHARRLQFVVLAHHPLAREPGREHLADAERWALSMASLIVVSSANTAADYVANYGVVRGRIVVAEPGVPRSLRSPTNTRGAPRLLCVGALVPRKGQDLLIGALARHAGQPWQLDLVGDQTRDPDFVARVRRRAAAAGLAARVRLRGAVKSLEPFWRAADVFVSASRHEGYGMAVAEAVARGLPVLTTSAGAIGSWLSPSAAHVAPSVRHPSYGRALAALLTSAMVRREAGARARAWSVWLPQPDSAAGLVNDAVAALYGRSLAREDRPESGRPTL